MERALEILRELEENRAYITRAQEVLYVANQTTKAANASTGVKQWRLG